MSRFIDLLRKASQEASPPLGFGKAALAPSRPRMVLIASLNPANASRMADYVSGADAGLWRISPGTDPGLLHKKSAAQPEIPWGLWLPGTSREETGAAAGASFDFVVFPVTAPLATLKEETGTGYILQVDASISDGLARTVDNLPVDAVLVASEPQPPFLTWRHLLLAERFAAVLDIPRLFAVPQSVTSDDLQMLWQAGVDGVVADAEAGVIPRLRQLIDELHGPPPRKRNRPGALLPRISAAPAEVAEEEEAEEEE